MGEMIFDKEKFTREEVEAMLEADAKNNVPTSEFDLIMKILTEIRDLIKGTPI